MQNLMKGKRFIEYNIDEAKENRGLIWNDAKTFVLYRNSDHVLGHLTGALFGLWKTFPLGRREIELLDNYTSALSVVINKLSPKEVTEKPTIYWQALITRKDPAIHFTEHKPAQAVV